ncbi:hypothetical protein HPP92_008026 [Vanilla planifolia]|uniref:X8 domain-containing protein n=1 Tax=Vanilla planifolia TaxID=51239 RepID=A0A835RBI5_VANPL|nr:hypothetical protein HPP92_008026 [Vanilla planifolia]
MKFWEEMDLRDLWWFIFIIVFLFSGSLAKQLKDSSIDIPSSATTLVTMTKPEAGKKRERTSNIPIKVLSRTQLKLLEPMPEMDVVTPIARVPVFNPSNPTAPTTPTFNPNFPVTTPSTPVMTPTNPYPYTAPGIGPPQSSSGQSWCIASQTASQTALQVALDYACGYGGADCSAIQPGASCYNPDTVHDHASYAFNSYYQKNPTPTGCDFGGTAIITNIDPSTSMCQYPSLSMSSSVLNATNPVGTSIYGSVPPDSTGRASDPKAVPFLLAMMCLFISIGQ